MAQLIPIGSLVSDPTTKRLYIIVDHIFSNRAHAEPDTSIIYAVHPLDGGVYKTYRYGFEIVVLSANTKL